ncbi:MAG: YHS domain-containing (seleno)protein [Azospirillaceae bacterium]
MYRSIIVAAAIAANAATFNPAMAADEVNTVPGLTAAGAPLGLHGVDPVALLEDGDRLAGTAGHTVVHDGVAYYFASADNAAEFEADPARFTPENGGFCTYGVSVGKKFDGDPRYAAVVDGKLYVFLNEEIFQAFNEDRAGTIARAAEQWPRIESVAATAL